MTAAVAKPEKQTAANGAPQPLATISKDLKNSIAMIEGIAKAYRLSALSVSNFERAFVIAEGIDALRKAFTDDVMTWIMKLQGNRLGFKTDKDKETKPGYPVEIVRDVMIEMILRGFLPGGNEINIIAGNGYGTKEGFERVVGELPGVTDVRHYPGTPVLSAGGGLAYVDYTIQCLHNGQKVRLDRRKTEDMDSRIVIRIHPKESPSPDNLLGKARRKALKFLFDHLTQSRLTIADGDVDEAPAALPSTGSATGDLAAKLAERAKALGTGQQLAEGELSADELKKINETEVAGTLPGMGTAAE